MSTTPARTFTTIIVPRGNVTAGILVPAAVAEALGAEKRLPVQVTLGSTTYRGTLSRSQGSYMVPLSARERDRAGVAIGDEVDVTLTPDATPDEDEVELPADFAAALDQEPELRQAFARFHASSRRRMVRSIEEAKTAATRERRMEKALDTLRTAPRDVAAAEAHDRQADDLPAKMGQPARRALAGAGYVRLEQLTDTRATDLRKLHGMGPKALDQLRQALAARGQSFADEA